MAGTGKVTEEEIFGDSNSIVTGFTVWYGIFIDGIEVLGQRDFKLKVTSMATRWDFIRSYISDQDTLLPMKVQTGVYRSADSLHPGKGKEEWRQTVN